MQQSSDNNSYIRYSILIIFPIIIYLVFVSKLYTVQISDNNYYKDLAERQYVKSDIESSERGRIYLSKYESTEVLAADMEDRKITKNGSEIILKERKYLLGDMASKVIGFVGYDENNKKVGRYGVEKYYNDILDKNKSKAYVNPFAQMFGDYKEEYIADEGGNSGDIVLTLDYDVQKYAYNLIRKISEKWKSKEVGIIVIDPNSGSIVAMEELPTYDLNYFVEVKDTKLYLNNAVSNVYEMGSIIKPITMATGIDTGAINKDTKYQDTGTRIISGKTVSNYDGAARGETGMQTILDQSLNLGIAFIVEKIGIKDFQKYFKLFGIGKETGIDLPSETEGLIKNLDSNVILDNVTSGFGQGIAISPIQTVRALSVLANGGHLVTPYIVSKLKLENGEDAILGEQLNTSKVITKSTSEEVTRMLVSVVDNHLAKGVYKNEKYAVAGKTGTAEIASSDGYYKDKYLHSIFAYFPAYKPKYLVFIYQVNPVGADYASQTLSEPLFEMIGYLIDYFEIPPDR